MKFNDLQIGSQFATYDEGEIGEETYIKINYIEYYFDNTDINHSPLQANAVLIFSETLDIGVLYNFADSDEVIKY